MNRRYTNEGRITGNKENRRTSQVGVGSAVTWTVRSPMNSNKWNSAIFLSIRNTCHSALSLRLKQVFQRRQRRFRWTERKRRCNVQCEFHRRFLLSSRVHCTLLVTSQSEFSSNPTRKITRRRPLTIEKRYHNCSARKIQRIKLIERTHSSNVIF
jgi:hypothetical protein